MTTFNTLKTSIRNIASTFLVAGLIVGCASVTDANLDQEEQQMILPTTDTGEVVDSERDNEIDNVWRNGDDMDPIIRRPDTSDDLED